MSVILTKVRYYFNSLIADLLVPRYLWLASQKWSLTLAFHVDKSDSMYEI